MGGEFLLGVAGVAATATIILLLVGVALFVLFRTLPGGRVMAVEAEPNQPFELRYTTPSRRRFRLCAKIRYHIGGAGGPSGFGGGPDEGLECDLHVTAGQRVVAEETVSFHLRTSQGVDRVITKVFMGTAVDDGFAKTRSGIYVLVEIPACPAGTEIVARGTFRPTEQSETSMLDVFLGR